MSIHTTNHDEELRTFNENTRARRYNKRLLQILALLGVINVFTDVYSVYDRQDNRQNDMARQERLGAIADVQVTTVNAGIRAGIYSAQEIETIKALEKKAQYNLSIER